MRKLFLILALAFGAISAGSATTNYALYVAGIQVNDVNRSDILGDGTVSYNPVTNTLTLNNANISCSTKSPIHNGISGLTMNCKGNNILTCTDSAESSHGLYVNSTMTITTTQANSSLMVNSPNAAVRTNECTTIVDGKDLQFHLILNGAQYGFLNTGSQEFSSNIVIKDANVDIAATSKNAIFHANSLTVDGAILTAQGNGSYATISCDDLIMQNGVAIRSNHTYNKATHKFLNAKGNEAKDDIIIGVDGRTVIKEISLTNLHAPTAGSVYTGDSMRATIRVPQDAVYGLQSGNVKLYKMTASGATPVADNSVITTGRYYVAAQVSINDDAKEEYRFPNQLKDLKTKFTSPRKWFLKNLIGNEDVVCYSDTFTVFAAYAFPDEVPDDLMELKGDTFRIYGVSGNLISTSGAYANFKDLAPSLDYHPSEFGYNPSLRKINICFNGTYWEIPQTSTIDWVDVYISVWDVPSTYDYSYQPNALPTERPDMKGASLVVCGTNIENYFSNYGAASKEFAKSPATEKEFVTKTQKIVAAFTAIDAQVYAMYEIGTGQSVHVLCDSLNRRYPHHPYAPLDCNFGTSTYQSVAYIYDSTKLDLVSAPSCMYSSGYMSYRMSRVTFRERASQQEFILCASHLKAFDDGESERIQQVNKLLSALRLYQQDNVLIVGDMNSHSLDVPSQMLADEYEDLLYTHDSLGFSYSRADGVAYLDHAYASASLAQYVTMATAMHVNTLASSDYGFASGDTTMYRYADHDPLLIGLNLTAATALEGVQLDQFTNLQTYKVIMDGQLLIMREGKAYNALGGRVK